jgi:hypothetical protein
VPKGNNWSGKRSRRMSSSTEVAGAAAESPAAEVAAAHARVVAALAASTGPRWSQSAQARARAHTAGTAVADPAAAVVHHPSAAAWAQTPVAAPARTHPAAAPASSCSPGEAGRPAGRDKAVPERAA